MVMKLMTSARVAAVLTGLCAWGPSVAQVALCLLRPRALIGPNPRHANLLARKVRPSCRPAMAHS